MANGASVGQSGGIQNHTGDTRDVLVAVQASNACLRTGYRETFPQKGRKFLRRDCLTREEPSSTENSHIGAKRA